GAPLEEHANGRRRQEELLDVLLVVGRHERQVVLEHRRDDWNRNEWQGRRKTSLVSRTEGPTQRCLCAGTYCQQRRWSAPSRHGLGEANQRARAQGESACERRTVGLSA